MKKNQGTSTAEKEDDTDSTATKTTATFTSNYELDWGDCTDDGMTEATTLDDHTYSFGRRRWMKLPAGGEHLHPKSARKNNPHRHLTQQAMSRHE